MSNPNPLFQELSSDPGQIAAVNHAGDLACRTLQNIGQLEVDREIIARVFCRLQAAASATPTNCASGLSMDLTALDYRQHGA
jgi:hypothetical protein